MYNASMRITHVEVPTFDRHLDRHLASSTMPASDVDDTISKIHVIAMNKTLIPVSMVIP